MKCCVLILVTFACEAIVCSSFSSSTGFTALVFFLLGIYILLARVQQCRAEGHTRRVTSTQSKAEKYRRFSIKALKRSLLHFELRGWAWGEGQYIYQGTRLMGCRTCAADTMPSCQVQKASKCSAYPVWIVYACIYDRL